jgi:hypothetical protein
MAIEVATPEGKSFLKIKSNAFPPKPGEGPFWSSFRRPKGPAAPPTFDGPRFFLLGLPLICDHVKVSQRLVQRARPAERTAPGFVLTGHGILTSISERFPGRGLVKQTR